jgi:hypothetical protein
MKTAAFIAGFAALLLWRRGATTDICRGEAWYGTLKPAKQSMPR